MLLCRAMCGQNYLHKKFGIRVWIE